MTDHEDNPPMTPPWARWPIVQITREQALALYAADPGKGAGGTIHFEGGPVDTSGFVASHNGPTPTTMSEAEVAHYRGMQNTARNAKLTRPVERYKGEAEQMIDEWTRLAVAAVQRARDATSGPRLVSELEEAQHAVGEALRWSKP